MNRSIVILLFSVSLISTAQVPEHIIRYRNDGKGNILNRKKGTLDGNAVRTVFYNTGEVSDWYVGAVRAPHLEWPIGTGHRHLDGFTFMAGAKVKITTVTGIQKFITPIETSYREEMDYDPVTGEIWGFEPLSGYSNPSLSTPAMSNNEYSYPAQWPAALGLGPESKGKWFGYFGLGRRSGVVETYYVMDDSRDKEYQNPLDRFYPVTSDSSRGGLGLRVDVHGLQFQDKLLEDILFWDYRITNISDMDYDSMAFGMFMDPSVGSVNNDVRLDVSADLTYAWSPGGKGLPDNYTTGYMGVSVLDAPQSARGGRVSSLLINMLGPKGPTSVWPKNDAVMWAAMTGGFKDTSLANGNFSVVIGSPVFSFPRYATERYDIAMILAEDLEALQRKNAVAQKLFDVGFAVTDSTGDDGALRIVSPAAHGTVQGTVEFTWSLTGVAGQWNSYVYISKDGILWKFIGVDSVGKNAVQWNSSIGPDGIFYRIAILAMERNGDGVLYKEQAFRVNNPAAAKPQIVITRPSVSETAAGIYSIRWEGGDADGDPCTVNLYTRLKTGVRWDTIAMQIDAAAGSYPWDTRSYPNSSADDYLVRGDIISINDTVSSVSSGFSVMNTVTVKQGDPYILSWNSDGTGKIHLSVIEPSAVTGHPYAITFAKNSQQALSASVTDLRTGTVLVEGVGPLDGNHETQTFDGIRLTIADPGKVSIDTATGLLPGSKTNASFTAVKNSSFPALDVAWPADYQVNFSSKKVDVSIFADPPLFIKDSVNFTVTNVTDGYRCQFLIHDIDLNGKFSPGDTVRILDGFKDISTFKICCAFAYSFPPGFPNPVMPSDGDIYMIRTQRPFIPGDSIIFTTKDLTIIRRAEGSVPGILSLSQNYPNPFNPSTTIRLSIPMEGPVNLSVYDILGKEISVLVDERLQAGEYSVVFNGSAIASGTYFMRLNLGGNTISRKLTIVK